MPSVRKNPLRRVAMALVFLMGALFLFSAPGVFGTDRAAAFLEICGDAGQASPVSISGGWTAPLGARAAEDRIGTSQYGATAYEWWGGNILSFSTDTNIDSNFANVDARENCGLWNGISGVAQSGLASTVWTMASVGNSLTMWVYQTAQSQETFSWVERNIIKPIVQGTQSADNPDGSTGIGGWYTQASVLILVIAGLYAGVRILRGRVKEALTGVLWQVALLSVGLLLMLNPGFLPGLIGNVASTGQALANEVATSVASSLGAGTSLTRDYCNLDENRLNYRVEEGATAVATRESTCRMWTLTYLGPWTQGQFGTTLPVATNSYNNDGTPALDRWNASKQNRELAVALPGLSSQPEAGSLVPLHLSALYINPNEQRYIDSVIAAEGLKGAGARSREVELINELRAVEEGTYPVDQVGNFCPSGGADCVVNKGHNTLWTLTRDRATESAQPGVALTWPGTSEEAASARWNATAQMGLGSGMALVTAGFFGAASIWYQFVLGFMIAFMGFALLAMLVPGYGVQVARDFFAKMLRNLIMWILATGFMTMTAVAVIYIPDMFLPDLTTSNVVGAATVGWQLSLRFILGIAVGAIMLLMWTRVRKALATRPMIKGARNDSAWDIGGAATNKIVSAGKVAGAAAVTAGAVVVSGGAAALAGAAAARAGAGSADQQGDDVPPAAGDSAAMGDPVGVAATIPGVAPAVTRGGVVLGGGSASAGVPVAPQPVMSGASVPGAGPGVAANVVGQQGAAAGATFGKLFRQELGKSFKGIGSSILGSIMSGQGLGAMSAQARNALTEAVTGVQTRSVVKDKNGRETIVESGSDARGGVATPVIQMPPNAVVLQDNVGRVWAQAGSSDYQPPVPLPGFGESGLPLGDGRPVTPRGSAPAPPRFNPADWQ